MMGIARGNVSSIEKEDSAVKVTWLDISACGKTLGHLSDKRIPLVGSAKRTVHEHGEVTATANNLNGCRLGGV